MKNFTKFLMEGVKSDSSSSVFRHVFLTLLCLVLGTGMAVAEGTNSTRTSVDLPNSPGYTLEPGKMYIVRSTMTINATAGNGLNVKTKTGGQQAPILYIPYGVTLRVTGASGNGITGGGAGIYVPKNAELIITGAGELVAQGGAAGNGGDGLNGKNGGNRNDIAEDWKIYNDRNECSGAGGNGGNGGGGAGAGIGGIGGQGGQGGAGGEARYFSKDTQQNGDAGHNGGAGAAGSGMGKVSIMGTVTVTATSGTAGTAGNGGQQGWTARHREGGAWYVAGAGGAGGGGGAGIAGPTSGFGAGAPGAGGGAGGGGGAVDYVIVWDLPSESDMSRRNNWSNRASSGAGGIGSTDGAAGSNTRGRDTGSGGTIVFTAMPRQGGVGGNGGAQGAKATGDDGYVYVANGATVNGKTGSETGNKPTGFDGTKGDAPTDMKITITFVNNEYDATAGSTDVNKGATVNTEQINIGDPLPNAVITTYKLTAKESTSGEIFAAEDKYFAGYYTADKGRGTRVYKGIGTTNLDIVSGALPYLAGDITLYAHFTHVHHTVNWDYTYSNGIDSETGKSTWVNLGKSQWLTQGKLTFYSRDAEGVRTAIKSVVMTAWVPNPETSSDETHNYYYKNPPLAGAENHTRSEGKIYLKVRSASEEDALSSDADINVYFTDEELVTFSDYEFEPWSGYVKDSEEGSKPANWSVINDRDTHHTVYSFTGAQGDNQYAQTWTVKLTGLKVYPDEIYVKPLYNTATHAAPVWDLISQLPNRYDGVICPKGTGNESTGYTYTGQYPVWKTDGSSNEYEYKIGLVGFKLNGEKYYMDPTDGAVSKADMQSPDTYNSSNNIGQYNSGSPIDIKFDVDASVIPVLRLEPNGGTLAHGTPHIVVDKNRTKAYNLSGYRAEREGYKQTGWNTEANAANWSTGTHYDLDANLTGLSGSALTLYAELVEATPPTINTHHIEYKAEGATIYVSVTDNVGVSSVQYIVSESTVADLEHASWEDATAGVSPLYRFNALSSKVNNKSFAYIYVKASDAAGNTTIMSAENLKIDGINPTYEIYPLGNVCNFPITITAKDNIKIQTVEYIQTTTELTDVTAASQEWTTVSSFTKDTNTEKAFTIAKLNGEEQKTCNAEETVHTPKIVSLRITDAAGNVTQYLNHTKMYYDHAWDTSVNHSAIYVDESGNYQTVHFYTCKHECDHIWAVEIIGAEPTDGEKGYTHDCPSDQHREQGLMRDETSRFINGTGSALVLNDRNESVSTSHGINNAINDINNLEDSKKSTNNEYTIILVDDTNIGWDTEHSSATAASTITGPTGDGVKVIIDLNGSGLLVNGAAGTITGASNVEILLTDNGVLPYTNQSTVTGSPIHYHRDFAASTRQGNWQALYVPFTTTTENYTVGSLNKVNTDKQEGEVELTVTKQDGPTKNITEFTPYFVRSANGKIDLTATVLQPSHANETPSESPTDYKQVGCFVDLDNNLKTSTNEDWQFWVLTNGGQFAKASTAAHQRPYHWVIYPTVKEGTPLGLMAINIVEEEAPTAITSVEAEAEFDANAPIYTISGTRVSNESALAPGIYIRGGKKFIVR